MTSYFAFYDPASGEILSLFSGTQAQAELQGGDFVAVTGEVFDTTHYLADGVAVAKALLDPTITHASLAVTLGGLPSGLTVEVAGFVITTDVEPLEITFELPGPYEIRVTGGIYYRDLTLTGEVTD